MKVRIKFSKSGALVYIGHLDVMRYFQKLFRRADIPICYSEGFSPHQILSFSHPLPLGMESLGEYADIEISEAVNSVEAIERMKKESVPEIEIQSFKELPDRCENAMASVRAARYRVDFNEGCPFDDLNAAINLLMAQDSLIITKTTKKSTKEEDIRPYIYECFVNADSKIEMLISSGSIHNVKPDLVVKAMGNLFDMDIDDTSLHMIRIDQYTEVNNELCSLNDIGKDIL